VKINSKKVKNISKSGKIGENGYPLLPDEG